MAQQASSTFGRERSNGQSAYGSPMPVQIRRLVTLTKAAPDVLARVVAAIGKLVNATASLIRLQWASPPAVPREAEQLSRAIADLSPKEWDELSRLLAALWNAFVEEFGGVDNFLSTGRERQEAYGAKLAEAAARFERYRETEKRHAYFAVALMRWYVQSLGRPADNESQDLSGRIVAALEGSHDCGRSTPPSS